MNVWTPVAWPIPQDSSLRLFLHGDGLADALVDASIRFLALHVKEAGVSAPAASQNRLHTLVTSVAGLAIICVLVRELHECPFSCCPPAKPPLRQRIACTCKQGGLLGACIRTCPGRAGGGRVWGLPMAAIDMAERILVTKHHSRALITASTRGLMKCFSRPMGLCWPR
jgi:hypothetical protein